MITTKMQRGGYTWVCFLELSEFSMPKTQSLAYALSLLYMRDVYLVVFICYQAYAGYLTSCSRG